MRTLLGGQDADTEPPTGSTPSRRRAVLGSLAAGAALGGMWAQLAPASYSTNFPGPRRFRVSLAGPNSEHLTRDVGFLHLALAGSASSGRPSPGGPGSRSRSTCGLTEDTTAQLLLFQARRSLGSVLDARA